MDDIRLLLPAGYEIHTSYDATEFIQEELGKIYLRTGVTVAILLLFVLLITFSPKYLFLIVTSLAVNVAIAVIFYYAFGLEKAHDASVRHLPERGRACAFSGGECGRGHQE